MLPARKSHLMPRRSHPDYAVDADRGTGPRLTKQAAFVDLDTFLEREQGRDGLRDLDAMVELMPGLNRMQKDRERILPRAATGELGHPRMRRTLPMSNTVRLPLSSRQRKERSKRRMATQLRMPMARLVAQHDLVTDPKRWSAINQALSDATGDIQELRPGDQTRVRRIDKAIQAYEAGNDRGHVVYTAVQLPHYINTSNLVPFVERNFRVGRQISFDRYTAAHHQLHESVAVTRAQPERAVIFEIQTRRGAYLGRSDRVDDTSHLLPRGLQVQVSAVEQVSYRARDGSTGSYVVVQLRDIDDEGEGNADGREASNRVRERRENE